MEKAMGGAIQIEQLLLGKEPAEMNLLRDPQLFGEFLEMRLQRPLPGDDQLRVRKFLLENGKGTEGGGHAFFGNEPASLHESPAAIDRGITPNKRKFVQRHARAIDAQ